MLWPLVNYMYYFTESSQWIHGVLTSSPILQMEKLRLSEFGKWESQDWLQSSCP